MEDLFNVMQLPRMMGDEPLSIRILVVGDLDINSASALAEHALNATELKGGTVDLICACGPFCQDSDLAPYLQRPRGSLVKNNDNKRGGRTREISAAMEGLVTGCICQLESIVCRLVWVPAHSSDPETLLGSEEEQGVDREYRLTPNSRNVNKHWIGLAPGLGCCGIAAKEESPLSECQHVVTKFLDQQPKYERQTGSRNVKFKCTHGIVLLTGGVLDSSTTTDERILLRICQEQTPKYSDGLLTTGSLRHCGDYSVVEVCILEEGEFLVWEVSKVQFFKLPLHLHPGGTA